MVLLSVDEHPKFQHERDIRTNLTGFAFWLQAYGASPQRNLSTQGLKQLQKLVKQRRANYNYIVGADGHDLHPDAEEALRLWEALPLPKDSAEWRRARERMIRDMLIIGRLEQEMSKGFEVTRAEIVCARLLICTNSTPGLASQMKCAPYPNRPMLKELDWDGAHLMSAEGAQTFVGVSDGVPEWKQEYEAYCERAKAAKQTRLAKRLESKKEKQKAKNKARKARKRVAGTSALGTSTLTTMYETSQSCVRGNTDKDMGVDGGYDEEGSDDGVSSDDDGPEPVERKF